MPSDVAPDWQPYTVGHWAYVDDYGWTWVSDEGDWGDIVYHYGRWVNDPDDGWLWIPGYVWSPAWVVWRSNGPYMGWMPMPPDDAFLGRSPSVSISFGDWGETGGYYGYSRWYAGRFDSGRFDAMWTFVPTAHMADRDYRSHAVHGQGAEIYINNSHNVTNYTIVNNVVVNRSVTIDAVQRASGHPVQVAHADQVFKHPDLITHADAGLQLQEKRRQADPRGNGSTNSAPKPNAAQLQTLSARPVLHNGKPAPHLFNRTTALKTFRRADGTPPSPVTAAQPPKEAGAPAPGGQDMRDRTDQHERTVPAHRDETPPANSNTTGAVNPSEEVPPVLHEHRDVAAPVERLAPSGSSTNTAAPGSETPPRHERVARPPEMHQQMTPPPRPAHEHVARPPTVHVHTPPAHRRPPPPEDKRRKGEGG